METDVLVVGGGPAGLSAAIAARQEGLRAVLVDAKQPPIDKTCGEGLLPEAVAALRELGVELGSDGGWAPWAKFAGIRFADESSAASARFGDAIAYGVRRTILQALLLERAELLGVTFLWKTHFTSWDSFSANAGGRNIAFRWLIAADGIESPIRRKLRLESRFRAKGRFAFRRHYDVAPWTDLVEVHWGKRSQMIVTPTGRNEVCVALFTSDRRERIDDALPRFPEVAKRIRGAQWTSSETGARTALARAKSVVCGNVALIGDAGCSIDGVAGQGLNLAFQEAIELGRALAREDLMLYAKAHRRITRTPMDLTRLLLLMNRCTWTRKKALRMFQAQPSFFAKMISIHAGATQSGDALRLQDLFGLTWEVLRA